MKTRTAWVDVIAAHCATCREELVDDCRWWELPLPTDRQILVPGHWLSRECPHGGIFRLEFVRPGPAPRVVECEDVEGQREPASDRFKDEAEIEAPWYWTNLDASKDIGYPCREEGRYGSYPSHDGFGDEANP